MSTESAVSSAVREQYDEIRRARLFRLLGAIALLGMLAGTFLVSLIAVKFRLGDLVKYGPSFVDALTQYFPLTDYDLGVLTVPFLDVGQYWSFIVERNLLFDFTDAGLSLALFGEAGITLAMAVAGTILGFPLALLFGVLGSGRVVPFPFNFIFRGTMSTIRAIPALVWALIYVPLGGISAFTATLAIATDTVGNLGRLYTDELEEIEDGPIEAMETTGGSRPQTIAFGMLSQVHTSFIAWTLYIFEINVRIAVSLGIIGGGGLGGVLNVQKGLFHYTNMMATILVIILLILTIELCSQRIRARLRADEEPMDLFELLSGFGDRFTDSLTK
jgi:phosphonate transport system permease protein